MKIILGWFSCKPFIHLSDIHFRCDFKSVPQIEYNLASSFMGSCNSLANPGVTATLAVCCLCQTFGIHSSALRWSEGADQWQRWKAYPDVTNSPSTAPYQIGQMFAVPTEGRHSSFWVRTVLFTIFDVLVWWWATTFEKFLVLRIFHHELLSSNSEGKTLALLITRVLMGGICYPRGRLTNALNWKSANMTVSQCHFKFWLRVAMVEDWYLSFWALWMI